jgi:hypothetical protein
MKKQPWEKDIENWKNRATVQGVIERVVNKYPYDDSRELFRSELEYLVDQAIKEEKKKALEILDQAEDENWFDMPDTTENWKTWKRIRNTINDS